MRLISEGVPASAAALATHASAARIQRVSCHRNEIEGFDTVELPRWSGDLWRGIRLEEFRIRTSGRLEDGYLTRHVLVIAPGPELNGSICWQAGPRFDPDSRLPEQPERRLVGIFPALWPYSATWSAHEGRGLFIELAPELLQSAARAAGTPHVGLRPGLFHDPFIFHAGHGLLDLLDERDPALMLQAEAIGYALASYLVQRYSLEARKPGRNPATPLPERILAELDVFIETRLDGSISLSQLSEVARMSVFHFARSFKQSTGVAPHAYVLRRRIERACVLLGDARLTIAEVAQQCGFSQQSHFAQTFRRFLGKTPRAYRAERN